MNRLSIRCCVCIFCLFFTVLSQARDYSFRNGITREVLENYLERAVTLTEFLTVNPFCNDDLATDKLDEIRMLKRLGVKFVGRAIYRWGGERFLADTAFLESASRLVKTMHAWDPDLIFQAAVFEIVTTEVNTLEIPAWTFRALGLSPEARTFRYEDMLNQDRIFVDHWKEGGSVPDISRMETQLWLMYVAGTYIGIGCEAIHWGQVSLMGMNDPHFRHWSGFMTKMREYVRLHAPRGWVLFDAHTPYGGMVVDGKSLLDFNSFPLRIKEIPEKPMEGELEMPYLDALYGRSKGCISPSGWTCESLPYLVEFDNFGISSRPGTADISSHFIWGYDEVSWFCLQDEGYRDKWLRYAYDWLRKHDPNGHLQMPLARIVTPGGGKRAFRFLGNKPGENCPQGMNVEETVSDIWCGNPENPVSGYDAGK